MPTNRRITPTLALCLAGGLAAGIALARPASSDAPPSTGTQPAAAVADGDGDDASSSPDGGYAYEFPAAADDEEGDEEGGTQTTAPSEATGPAESASITIADFAFGEPITVAPGTPITVTNLDSAPHTVSAVDGSFDTGNLGQGDAAVITAPSTPGTYAFFCAIHPSMIGELVVS